MADPPATQLPAVPQETELTMPLVAESRPGSCLAALQAPPFSVATNPWDFPEASVKDPPAAQLPAEAQDTESTAALAAPPDVAATAPLRPRADPQCPAGVFTAAAAIPPAAASAQQAAARTSARTTRLCMNSSYLATVSVFTGDADLA
jgi:hypothetical protein